MEKLLEVRNLSVEFYKGGRVIPALRNVFFKLGKDETVGIVGESGCGKSTLALSILRLVPEKEGRITSGEILFRGRDVLGLSPEELLELRGGKISIIFQDPFTSLNPVFRIKDQICEAILLHRRNTEGMELEEEVIRLLELVKLPFPKQLMNFYPHQLSGGMQQRVMIAMALSSYPEILLADEPTTALDATIQKEILLLLKELQEKFHISIVLITHDFGIIAQICQKVFVMYAGTIVEEASTYEIFHRPIHPYTKGLIESLPIKRTFPSKEKKMRLTAIPGQVPDPGSLPQGCKFHPRCRISIEDCKKMEPDLKEITPGHWVRCLLSA